MTTVLFDMGGTLEDIWVDESSEQAAIQALDRMLKEAGLDQPLALPAFKRLVDAGWRRYEHVRDGNNVELKPSEIWCDFALAELPHDRAQLAPHCEEIAHMWELTHYHRQLRPRVGEMLAGLRDLGLKLGIISNTAALFQVFDSLEAYGIRDYFQDVTLSSVTGLRKPAGDIFTVSLRQVQSAPCECVYVGDTISRDVIGSKQAGFAVAIQIASKLTQSKDAQIDRTFEPDYVIENIYDVYPLLKRLREATSA